MVFYCLMDEPFRNAIEMYHKHETLLNYSYRESNYEIELSIKFPYLKINSNLSIARWWQSYKGLILFYLC